MAPKKDVTSTVSTGDKASTEAASGSNNTKPKAAKVIKTAAKVIKTTANPSTLSMVVEVLKKSERKGTSVQSIRNQIMIAHPTVDPVRLKFLLRSALKRGLEKGILIRPLNSSASGATGRFKLAKVEKPKGKSNKTGENEDPNSKVEDKDKKAEKPKKPKAQKEESKGLKEKKPKAAKKAQEESEKKPKPAAKPKKEPSEKAKVTEAPPKKPKAQKEKADEAEVPAKVKEPAKPKKEPAKANKETKAETSKAKKDATEDAGGKETKKAKK
ncbi:protein B4 [Bombina bombina]|uniref:protein B4 n=1 Tax=Bombina bombina TaxID=8345 RepID=UPI00235A7AA0|nr:protein B4 [Bombina bombina]